MDGESKSSKDMQYPENLYEATLNNLDDVVHVIDKEMNVLFINKAIEALSRGELKQEDIIGKNLCDVFPFLKEKGVDKEYERVFSTGKPLKTEEWTDYHGEKIFTLTKKIPIKNEKGVVIQIITVIRDLTEMKKIEETLRESAEKYGNIVELAQEGICIDDENENIVFSNEAFAKILGYEKKEIIGMKVYALLNEEGKKKLEEENKKRRGGKSSRYEITMYAKNGEPKTMIVSASPLYDSNGSYKGSISVNMDITERKKAERELKKAYKEVERALKQEREFKTETAHYFFNLLCIAEGYLHLAIDKSLPEEKEKIEKALRALERIENVVENVVKRGEIRE